MFFEVILERYLSGQRGQTVNLLALPSEVRILLSPPVSLKINHADGVLLDSQPTASGRKMHALGN